MYNCKATGFKVSMSLGGHFFINNPLVLYTDRLELCIPRPVWPFLPPKITIIDCLNFL